MIISNIATVQKESYLFDKDDIDGLMDVIDSVE
jgi:hypothetical protein